MQKTVKTNGDSSCYSKVTAMSGNFLLTKLPQAPSEAEAQCAELARGGKVYAAGSEDMDTLTFATPILYRHLTFSEAKKQPISEISLQKTLEGLEMSMSQVITPQTTEFMALYYLFYSLLISAYCSVVIISSR